MAGHHPRFAHHRFASPPVRALFELRPEGSTARLAAWPLPAVVAFVTRVRDAAAARLTDAVPERAADCERFLVGRSGAGRPASGQRVRIVPLPSIGHPEVDRGIRRVMVEVPTACPLRADDVRWAFSGLTLEPTDRAPAITLVPTSESGMQPQYGVDSPAARRWRSITAVALPRAAGRRWADDPSFGPRGKDGTGRIAEERRAASALVLAVRHADVPSRVRHVRVQREAFEARGARAEDFAAGTRFSARRLWHAEIEFDRAVAGPVVIGDGRFLGLGLMAPVRRA